MNEWKFGKLQKKYTQNLTRCIFLNSKYDALYFFKFRIWRAVFLSNQNLSHKENFNSKSCFLKKHKKCKICRFHGVKSIKTWFFRMQTFFKIWHVENFFNSKSNALYFFQSKIWRVVTTSNQNLTRCETFNSKSDKFQKVFSEIWFLSCSSGSDWMMIFSVNVITNLFLRRELEDNACCRVSRQMDNWKLPHVNSSLNVWGIASWQHTISTKVTDRTL